MDLLFQRIGLASQLRKVALLCCLGEVGGSLDDMRHALLCGAQALVVPSPYESLSIVLLEAWNRSVPALVNAHCAVLKGQVRRGNGGLFYRSQREFAEGLDYLLVHDAERAQLGVQGRAYVDREYRWSTVLARVEALLEASLRPR